MGIFAVLFMILFAVFAMLWLESLWSNAITLVNVTLASLLALNFFEPLAASAEGAWGGAAEYTYFWDVLCLWFLFAVFFALLRLCTDFISRTRVKFKLPVEMAGKALCGLLVGWVMTCFTAVSFHVAPLAPASWGNSFTATPESKSFLIANPDHQLLGFMQMVSRGSLSAFANANTVRSNYSEDAGSNVFDPNAEFIPKYRQRRKTLEGLEGLRVPVQ